MNRNEQTRGDLSRLEIRYQGKVLDFSSGPRLMGVLNVTPDSFSDGGAYIAFEDARAHAMAMISAGADIIDVGAESTRPGSDAVSAETQIKRAVPVIVAIRGQWDGWISIDTCSAEVARAALDAGADMINDVSAGLVDPVLMDVAAEYGSPSVLMHMKGTPKTMQKNPVYERLMPELADYFQDRIARWCERGVQADNILIDPGIGFGKTVEHNLAILRDLAVLTELGRPIVLGTSRKSFIGTILDRPVDERLSGTLATVAIGVWNGASVIRVHDVPEARDVATMVYRMKTATA